ncbi:MAG: arginine--tRNA ligase [Verrucomicrobiae bacterium]|nr:arginine--tRNA ligase [Verrucomicrobiae bacterium]
MKLIPLQIAHALLPSVEKLTGQSLSPMGLVKPCQDPSHGDYQCNAAMSLARGLKQNPRDLAARIIESSDLGALCETPQIAGPGFINFRLKPEYLASQLTRMDTEPRLGVEPVTSPRTIVVDFSAPNVAKQMHVGHIRSTILGDCLARILRFLGHRVVTDNHIGDWGTQFGKLIVGYKRHLDAAALERDPIAELERLYKTVNSACEEEEKQGTQTLMTACREELRKLQEGDAENLALWRLFIDLSKGQFESVYGRLGVKFDHTLGESFYNPMLKGIVQELLDRKVAEPSQGAVCVFFPENKELAEKPFLIQKSDGAALYATTDLATLRYRQEHFAADEIIYVTDGRQQLHFKQLFATAQKWGIRMKLVHVWFGAILGENGKPIKTRSGDPIKLVDLLDEAESRSRAIFHELEMERQKKGIPVDSLSDDVLDRVVRVVGLGAVKYADLVQNRTSDYVFDWDKMLSMQGNTAPYLQNAYARIRSIQRKSGSVPAGGVAAWKLDTPQEIRLAAHLLKFGETLEVVVDDSRPNILCLYLYDLAGHLHSFYEHCNVLNAEGPLRESRLRLIDLTARTLREGLELLGIDVVERM